MNEHEHLDDEEVIANELALRQEVYAAQQQLQKVIDQGKAYRHPSIIKYGILYFIAIGADAMDIILYLIGFGAILAVFISLAATTIITTIMWFTDTEQKDAKAYSKNALEEASAIAQRIESSIARTARLGEQAAKRLKKTRFTGLATKLSTASKRITTYAAKSPITRSVTAGLANLVPFIAIFPFLTLGVYLSYRAEKHSYKQARDAAESITDTA
jgi:hypothetical protein